MGRTSHDSLANAAARYIATKSARVAGRILGRRSLSAKRRKGKVLLRFNPWENWEIRLLGKMMDKEVAGRTGRSASAVMHMRQFLKIPAFWPHLRWHPDEDALLGKLPDVDVADRTGRTLIAVIARRVGRGIKAQPTAWVLAHRWKRHEVKMLGQLCDHEVAHRLRRTLRQVQAKR